MQLTLHHWRSSDLETNVLETEKTLFLGDFAIHMFDNYVISQHDITQLKRS